MLFSWLLGTALAGECEFVSFADVIAHEPPAVIVLGERHGVAKDLARAMRVVRKLRDRAPVTLALEAVHRDEQDSLDGYAAGRVRLEDLPDELAWDRRWGFRFAPYRPLVTASEEGVRVVGVGLDLGPKPADAQIPIPSGYADLLRPAMAGHDVPLEREADFVAAMAWRDHELARMALEAWDGEGYLVLVVGRGHVEGGIGTPWQAAQLTSAPIHAYTLAVGPGAPCHPGDRLWR